MGKYLSRFLNNNADQCTDSVDVVGVANRNDSRVSRLSVRCSPTYESDQCSDDQLRKRVDCVSTLGDLLSWKVLVKEATTPQAVIALVSRFQPLHWTDEQRAEMSQVYIKRLESLETSNAR